MDLKKSYKNPQILAEIAVAFLMILCCVATPLTARADFFGWTQASIFSFWQGVTCFFGINCPAQTTQTANQAQPESEGLSPAKSVGETGVSPSQQSQTEEVQQNSSDRGLTPAAAGDRPRENQTQTPTQIIQNINPTKEIQTKEIQTIHTNTVTEHINTVVIDEETKNKVNTLLRQLDSDRPNYSVGQSYALPANLLASTLNINSGAFSISAAGDANAQNITTEHDLTVRGNFAVSGSQTYSGAASFTAASTGPALSVANTGSGVALQADNITVKTNTINTTTGNLVLNSSTGLVEIAGSGIKLANTIPADTAMALYNDSGTLKWNGASLALGSSVSGTTNYLPKFTSGTSLGNSVVYETAGGNVGIGTTTPGALLHIAGALDTGGDWLRLERTGTRTWALNSANGYLSFKDNTAGTTPFTIEGASLSNSLYIKSSGNVGIGTTAPGYALDIADGRDLHARNANLDAVIGDTTALYLRSGSSNLIYFNNNGGGTNWMTINAGNVGIGTTGPAQKLAIVGSGTTASTASLNVMNASSTSALFVLDSGNVGIGTTGPTGKLQIVGGSVLIGTPTVVSPAISIKQSADTIAGGILLEAAGATANGGIYYNGTGLVLRETGVDTLTARSGNVGIGTTAPAGLLAVGGAGSSNYAISGIGTNGGVYGLAPTNGNAIYGNTTTGRGVYGHATTGVGGVFSSDSGYGLIVDSGNVGIGTTNPGTTLDVNGTIQNTSLELGAVAGQIRVRGSSNPLILSVADSERMRITSAGNVGIGTTAPGYPLDVSATGGTALFRFTNSVGSYTLSNYTLQAPSSFLVSSGSGGYLNLVSGTNASGMNFTVNGSERMKIDTSGNVGIGTTSPGDKLDVNNGNILLSTNNKSLQGISTLGGIADIAKLDASNNYQFAGSSMNNWYLGLAVRTRISGVTNSYIGFDINGSERMRIDSSGNVGIGTTGPSGKLSIGVSPTTGIETNALNFVYGSGTELGGIRSYNVNGFNQDMRFYVARGTDSPTSALAMTIQGSSGNVGIGTTSPTFPLEVNGRARASSFTFSGLISDLVNNSPWNGIGYSNLLLGDPTYFATQVAGYYGLNFQTNSGQMVITKAGNVGIGTTTPSYPLTVVGTANASTFYIAGNGNNLITLSSAGSNYGQIMNNSADSWSLGYGTNIGGSAGTSVLSWNSAGNVGIGTTGPLVKLHVAGDYTVIDGLGMISAFTPTGGYARFAWWDPASTNTKFAFGSGFGDASRFGIHIKTSGDFSAATERFTILNSGNVGIGTTGPGQKLDIQGNPANDGFIGSQILDTGLNKGLLIGVYKAVNGNYDLAGLWPAGVTPGTSNYIFGTTGSANDTYFNTPLGKNMHFQVAASTKMYIDSAGNVGIGTTGPAYALDVAGSTGFVAARFKSSYSAKAMIGTDNSASWFGNDDGSNGLSNAMYFSSANYFALKTNNSERVRIDSAGNVGIGTTGPSYKLDVNGTLNASATSTFAGRVGIGTTAPQDVFHIVTAPGGGQLFQADTNTGDVFGLYFKATPNTVPNNYVKGAIIFEDTGNEGRGSMHFAVNGVADTSKVSLSDARLSINSAGNVGIGTTGPLSKLHLNGAVGALSGGLAFGDGDSGLYEFSDDGFRLQTAGSDRVAIDSAGNVGIGTTAPLTNLDVSGGIYARTALYTPSISSSWIGSATNLDFRIGSSAAFTFTANGNEKVRIDNTGNVGIGTTGPGALLDVSKATGTSTVSPATIRISSASTGSDWDTATNWGNLDFYSADTSIGGAKVTSRIGARTHTVLGGTGDLVFSLSDNSGVLTDRMVLDYLGNVGIGTTGPVYKLEVYNDTADPVIALTAGNNTQRVRIGATLSGATGSDLYFITKQDGVASSEKMRILGSGNVGIGTTGPVAKLEVIVPNAEDNTRTSFMVGTGMVAGDMQLRMGVSDTNNYGWISATELSTASRNLVLNSSGGNVGIGTTGPTQKLHIGGGNVALDYNNWLGWDVSGNFRNVLRLTAGNSTQLNALAGNALQFMVGEVEKMRLDSTGNVGIGTTGPSSKLHVVGADTSTSTVAQIGGLSGTGLVVLNNGFVGIGVSAPRFALEVGGANSIYTSGYIYGNGFAGTADGSASAAQFTRNGDADTGMFFGGANVLAFTTGASERLRIDSAGNVGIGTTGPTKALEVYRSTDGLAQILLNNASTGTSAYAESAVYAGTTRTYYGSTNQNYVGTGGLDSGGLGYLYSSSPFAIGSGAASGYVSFYSGGIAAANERIRITSAGNVGIGTTAPAAIFDVQYNNSNPSFVGVNQKNASSAGKTFFRAVNDAGKSMVMGVFGSTFGGTLSNNATLGGSAGFILMTDGEMASGGTDPMIFATGGYQLPLNERMRIDSAGNVGIGTTNPGTKLSFGDGNGDKVYFYELGSDKYGVGIGSGVLNIFGGTAGDIQFRDGGPSGTVNVHFDNDGNVGIGTTGPSQKLEVNGKVKIGDLTTAGGADDVYSVGGVLTTVVSSRRFKENIRS